MRPGLWLTLIAASFFVGGLAEAYVGFPNGPAVLQALALLILSFEWCKADIAARNIEAPGGSAFWVAMFALAGVPLYFFRSRPPRDAAIATGKAIAFLCLSLALSALGTYLGVQLAE